MNTRTDPHIHQDNPPCTCDLTSPDNCPRHCEMTHAAKPVSMRYVVGFLFSPSRGQVALIRKNKPTWQAGLLNGIGGKIEQGELARDAMVREFKEETSVDVRDWRQFAVMNGNGYVVHFFVADATVDQFNNLQSTTEELIEVVPFNYACEHRDCIPNLRWLIPLALDKDRVTAEVHDGSLPGEG
jgi:8-oxo-dGTP diphosphatase